MSRKLECDDCGKPLRPSEAKRVRRLNYPTVSKDKARGEKAVLCKRCYAEQRFDEENKWISGAIKKPGQLHRDLGVPQGEKIPAETLRKAAKKKGKVGQRARLAMTLKKMRKEGVDIRDRLDFLFEWVE